MKMLLRFLMPWMYMSMGEEGAGGGEDEGDAGEGSGDTGGDTGDGGSGDAGDGDDKGSEGEAGDFKVPEAYKDKPWAKKVKSEEDLYKMIDGSQELIGKKTLPPKFEDMTGDEITDYFSQATPEDANGYTFPEGTTDEQKTLFGGWLKESGIDDYRAKTLMAKYVGHGKAQQEEAFSVEGMKTMLSESFGEKGEEIGGKTANFIKGNLTEADALLIEQIPNKFLGVIYRLSNKVMEAYGIKETGRGGSQAGAVTGDVDAKRKEVRGKIIALSGKPHSAQEKQVLVDELNKLYGRK